MGQIKSQNVILMEYVDELEEENREITQKLFVVEE